VVIGEDRGKKKPPARDGFWDMFKHSAGNFFEHLLVDVEIGVHVLHVVMIF
jgi:hypothetical protein